MSDVTFVGLDVHNDSITAAILPPDSNDPQILVLPADLMKVRQFFRRLSDKGPVRACYEASGAGFVLQRSLAVGGIHCDVIAPSLIPRRAGDHRKTDRLDAIMLARLYRSGHLTPVHVPTEEQEALRRLLRLRRSYHAQITSTKHRISGTLRNHGHIFTGTKHAWTKKHFLWLGHLRQTLQGHLQTALSMDLQHLEYLESLVRALDGELEKAACTMPYRPKVEALCCLRGVKILTALTLLCEIDDITRFASPAGLMAYFGLVPSEHSSGNVERRGPITKAGNTHARRLLVEAAWNNRHGASAELVLNRRRLGQPPAVVAIALNAQHRLHRKFVRLIQRKHLRVAITAVARELCGFVWAILTAMN